MGKMEKNMANYRNHKRFSIKCLKHEIIPVSVKLKTNVHTAKGLQIIRRPEKQLWNECIRSINNMLEVYTYKSETYFHQLKGILDHNTLEECQNLIKRVIECRHVRVLERQKTKFEALQQQKTSGCSNRDDQSNNTIYSSNSLNNATEDQRRWVQNLSSKPLTNDQESLLAHGPKFAISPKYPPVQEYIVAIEQACSKLNQGESEELRVDVKKALKKAQRPPSNISKEEYKALNELKKDNSKMILTTDKGVALVVMDKVDYTKKVEELLNKPTYKKIPEDPTSRQKNKLINLLKRSRPKGA